MAQKSRVVVSIDLTPQASQDELSFVNQTLELLDRLGVSATWTTPDPRCGSVGRIVAKSGGGHEIALATHPSWASPDRTGFANGLTEQLAQAAADGLNIQTLLAPAAAIAGRWDLLVKHRIMTLRVEGAVTAAHSAESARFGVRIAPSSIDLHGDFPWWTGGARAAVRRSLHQSIQQRKVAHIAMNVRDLVAKQREAAAHAALQDAANRAHYGLSEIVTLQNLARDHRILRTGTSRSILRAA